MDGSAWWIVALGVVGVLMVGLLSSPPGPLPHIERPAPNAVLRNPVAVEIAGLSSGAAVGVRLRDSLGRIIAEKAFVARGDRAEALVYFDIPTTGKGTVEVFSLSDGSVLVRRPVQYAAERGRWVKVYFIDVEGKLFPAVRRIPGTPQVATEAVRALLAGPTLPEERAGIWSAAPRGAELVSISISGGVAEVELAVPDPHVPALELFSAQLRSTLLQFSTIAHVEIRFIGN